MVETEESRPALLFSNLDRATNSRANTSGAETMLGVEAYLPQPIRKLNIYASFGTALSCVTDIWNTQAKTNPIPCHSKDPRAS